MGMRNATDRRVKLTLSVTMDNVAECDKTATPIGGSYRLLKLLSTYSLKFLMIKYISDCRRYASELDCGILRLIGPNPTFNTHSTVIQVNG